LQLVVKTSSIAAQWGEGVGNIVVVSAWLRADGLALVRYRSLLPLRRAMMTAVETG